MRRGLQGLYVRQRTPPEPFDAFDPAPLPPKPDISMDREVTKSLSRADQMLGRLDGLSRVLPDPNLLIFYSVRKEAVLSSQIEGTQSTLSEFLLYEIEPSRKGPSDAFEVSNYIAAMNLGISRLKTDFPLSLRLVREMHSLLLQTGRGSRQTPGEFRTTQNWIGGSRPGNALYVPPPVSEMHRALDRFEKFLYNEANDFPVLIQCAMVHLQFESIHPFLDGNGRIGRLLITLLLLERGVLAQPLLYMSLYLKQNREQYYSLLQSVRTGGDWEAWIVFFLDGVASTSEKAVTVAKNVLELFDRDRDKILGMGGKRASALRVFAEMQRNPYLQPSSAAAQIGLSYNTVVSVVNSLVNMGILREVPLWGRGRIFQYARYLALLEEGS